MIKIIRPSILIREDDDTLRKLLCECVSEQLENCEVKEVQNAEEILRIVREKAPNLLITDLHGPWEHGIAMIKKIRERFDDVDFPILVISGNISDNEKGDLEKLNVTFMRKPFPLKALSRYLTIVFKK